MTRFVRLPAKSLAHIPAYFSPALAVVLACSSLRAAPTDAPSVEIDAKIKALESQVQELRSQANENWLNDQRTTQIKAIVEEVLADAKARGQSLDGDLQAGYKNGFFVQTADKNYKLVVGGYAQFRYTYDHSELKNAKAFGASPPAHGDANGFDFRRARITFGGNVLNPDLTYFVSGDFASGSSNSGNFQLVDYYGNYRFSDLLNVRAGSFLVPFSHSEYVTAASQLVDQPGVLLPFDPVRALGVSVLGQPIVETLSYELNVNDGSKSNIAGRVDDTGGKLDNRLGFYGRTQFAGSGKLSDFATDETDLAFHDSFVWLLGAAAGYESQNANSKSFPAAQSTLALSGLSTGDSPGFKTGTLNGDIYRATVDAHAKWQGLALNNAVYFQQINQNDGGTFPYTKDASFGQFGYYAQAGYFVVPKKLELVARFGQLITEGYPNRGEEYTLGANYYIYGHNLKIQSDLSYVPNEAFLSDPNTGQIANTQDIIARVQVQVKF